MPAQENRSRRGKGLNPQFHKGTERKKIFFRGNSPFEGKEEIKNAIIGGLMGEKREYPTTVRNSEEPKQPKRGPQMRLTSTDAH